jgi:hypothetical protein
MARVAIFFLISLVIPLIIYAGPLRLLPHRLFLLALFVPLLAALVSGRGGRMVAPDYLVIGAVIWSSLAYFASVPGPEVIEPIGIYVVEFLGAYLVGRIAIRSAEDFRRFARFFFLIILALLPCAAVESILHRAFLLELVPFSYGPAFIEGRLGLRRAQTLFAHPILFGTFVSTGLGLCWYALAPSAGVVARAVRTAPVALATFFSLSAGALVALLVQSVLIGWDLISRGIAGRWKIFGWGVALAYVTIDTVSNRTPFHILTDYTFSKWTGYYRIHVFNWGVENIKSHPLFGLGLNIYRWERASWMSDSIDNFWLLMTMQFGLPAFLMLALAIFLIVRGTTKAALADPVDRACRAGYLVSLAGLIVAGGTVHYWQAMLAFFMFILGSGMWLITGGAARAPVGGQTGGRRHRRRDAKAQEAEPVPAPSISPERPRTWLK